MISTIGRIVGWIFIGSLALAVAFGTFLYVGHSRYGIEMTRASHNTVCRLLRAAEQQGMITSAQRSQWAKVATPAEELAGGREFADYYMSDCTLTWFEFEQKHKK